MVYLIFEPFMLSTTIIHTCFMEVAVYLLFSVKAQPIDFAEHATNWTHSWWVGQV